MSGDDSADEVPKRRSSVGRLRVGASEEPYAAQTRRAVAVEQCATPGA